jgi:hypothetical protein
MGFDKESKAVVKHAIRERTWKIQPESEYDTY